MNDYENIASMLPAILTDGSAKCPLCGRQGKHQHSPAEIISYRNGVKYGRSLTNPMPTTGATMKPTKEMIDRFLTWQVPASVYPDGIPGQPGRTGTNLLTAGEAEQMLTHVLDGLDDELGALKAAMNDAVGVLRMVDDNYRVYAGEKRKAWSGDFVIAEIRRVLM